jgi:hypothetical protein
LRLLWIEYFDTPGEPREALDHYLSKNRYSFAAANLRNLVPMGHKCNSNYKHSHDILRRADGSRRRAFDPYGGVTVSITLAQSQPFAGTDGLTPAWKIEFAPNYDEVATWNEIFRIGERYERDVLDDKFGRWIEDFWAWCRAAVIVLDGEAPLLRALKSYAEFQAACGLSDRAFLKAAMFRMLLRHCQKGDERLALVLRGVV